MPMSMTYCAIENAYKQLKEAEDRLNLENLSDSEEAYRTKLIALCAKITSDFDEEINPPKPLDPVMHWAHVNIS